MKNNLHKRSAEAVFHNRVLAESAFLHSFIKVDIWGNKIKELASGSEEENMRNALKTIEEGNLYSRFGLVEDLSEDEMMDVDGGDWCVGKGSTFCICNGKSSSPSNGKGSGSGSGSGRTSSGSRGCSSSSSSGKSSRGGGS